MGQPMESRKIKKKCKSSIEVKVKTIDEKRNDDHHKNKNTIPRYPAGNTHKEIVPLDPADTSNFLNDLLGPISSDVFLKDYFGTEYLHIQHNHHTINNDDNVENSNNDDQKMKRKRKFKRISNHVKENDTFFDIFEILRQEYLFNLNVNQLIRNTASEKVFAWCLLKDENEDKDLPARTARRRRSGRRGR